MKKKRILLRKPDSFAYGIFKLGSRIMSKFFFNLKVVNNEAKNEKGGYVVIANHESLIDFFNLNTAIKGKSHFIISYSFYSSINLKYWFDRCGLIPKQQFQTNPTDLKKMRAALHSNNLPLVLYPTGLMTADGIDTPMPTSTGKALKWFNKNVYVARIEGSYLTKPKWGKGYRKGKVTLNIYKLFSSEQLSNLSEEEVQKTVEEHLKFDVYENQERNMIEHKNGDIIEGLENVLYQCPKCFSKYTMRVENKNTLRCSHCQNGAKANKFGFLEKTTESDVIFKHPSDWSRFIKDNIRKECSENDIVLSSHAEIYMINHKKCKYEKVGEGIVTLDKDKFNINGKIIEKEYCHDFPVSQLISLPVSPGRHFEIQDGIDIYRIILDNKAESLEWISTLEIFNQNSKLKLIK